MEQAGGGKKRGPLIKWFGLYFPSPDWNSSEVLWDNYVRSRVFLKRSSWLIGDNLLPPQPDLLDLETATWEIHKYFDRSIPALEKAKITPPYQPAYADVMRLRFSFIICESKPQQNLSVNFGLLAFFFILTTLPHGWGIYRHTVSFYHHKTVITEEKNKNANPSLISVGQFYAPKLPKAERTGCQRSSSGKAHLTKKKKKSLFHSPHLTVNFS